MGLRIEIDKKSGESYDDALNRALKKFRKMCDSANMNEEWQRIRYYEKPSVKRNKKRRQIERMRMFQEKNQQIGRM